MILLVLVIAGAAAFVFLRSGDEGRKVDHAALVSELDALCAELVEAGRALEPPFRPYGTTAEPYFSSFLELVEEAKGKLEDLEPPAEDRAAYDVLVDGYRQIESHLEEAQAAAAVEQDQEIVTRIAEIGDETAAMAESERAIGACAGETSIATLPKLLGRTVPNPLEETGEL